jgi:hypothetical protein
MKKITKKVYLSQNARTLKNNNNKIKGNIIGKKEGWLIVKIYGDPYERGYAHGYLLYKELIHITKILPFLIETQFKIEYATYVKDCKTIITHIIKKKYSEFYDELRGIINGCKKRGCSMTLDELIGWNSFLSMYLYYTNKNISKCSAFIATGNATEDGKIIMAHNTHCNFIEGQTQNIILYVYPTDGYSFVMQTAPGYIASGTDWFICSSGMIGCETTISNPNYKLNFGSPYFCRIRQAMQYGKNIDSYVDIMLEDNAGDYACSWLFGDINTNEIILFELGLKEHSIQRTYDGLYYGMNSVIDENMRKLETTEPSIDNLKISSGSRNVRLNHLLNEKYYGKINLKNAKDVMSDHYDSYLNKNEMNRRSICNHCELHSSDMPTQDVLLFGCTDAKVVNTDMAKNLEFEGRFGSSCGRKFNIKQFIIENPEHKESGKYLKSIPYYKWAKLSNKK